MAVNPCVVVEAMTHILPWQMSDVDVDFIGVAMFSVILAKFREKYILASDKERIKEIKVEKAQFNLSFYDIAP